MKKIINFLKTNVLVVKWTLAYFIVLWAILQFLFNFDMFSAQYWHKFFHSTLHGFGGFVFILVIYSAIPLYIASTLIVYRKKIALVTIPVPNSVKSIPKTIEKIFTPPVYEPVKQEEKIESPTPTPTPVEETATNPEFPPDMPRELYVPYTRAKQNLSLSGAISSFNKPHVPPQITQEPEQTSTQENESFPIPNDFDISDSLPNDSSSDFSNGDFPVFKDLDFDTPIEEKPKLSNSVTKYCDKNKIEYETYQDFVATNKYLIYDHDDGDFWIMDDDSWFASKKHRESPIKDMLKLAKQNELIPVLFLESQNIMDLYGTIEKFESMGIRVIKNLDELK